MGPGRPYRCRAAWAGMAQSMVTPRPIAAMNARFKSLLRSVHGVHSTPLNSYAGSSYGTLLAISNRFSLLVLHQIGFGIDRQQERFPGFLLEVEIVGQVAQLRRVLPHVGARVRTSIGRRIESLAAQEVILNEFEVGIKCQRLMVDVPFARVWADDQTRNPQAVPQLIDDRRLNVVVKATPVVPGDEDGGT